MNEGGNGAAKTLRSQESGVRTALHIVIASIVRSGGSMLVSPTTEQDVSALGGLQEQASDAVCVAVHIRPLVESEHAEGCQTCLSVTPGQPQASPYTAVLLLHAASYCM